QIYGLAYRAGQHSHAISDGFGGDSAIGRLARIWCAYVELKHSQPGSLDGFGHFDSLAEVGQDQAWNKKAVVLPRDTLFHHAALQPIVKAKRMQSRSGQDHRCRVGGWSPA